MGGWGEGGGGGGVECGSRRTMKRSRSGGNSIMGRQKNEEQGRGHDKNDEDNERSWNRTGMRTRGLREGQKL